MGEWIDEVARSLAGGASRRSALRRIGGGLAAIGLSFMLPKPTQAEKDETPGNPGPCDPPKVGICHRTRSKKNPFVFICVDSEAVPDHVKNHGDGLLGDVNNCGTCGNKCPSGPQSSPVCRDGRCGIVCERGFADCDNDPRNGCEVNTNTDKNNCGGCGRVCPGAQTCQGGVCGCAGVTCTDPFVLDPLTCKCVCKSGTRPCGTTCCSVDQICLADGTCGARCAQGDNCAGQQVCGPAAEDCTTLRAVEGDCFCHDISPCAGLTTCTSSASCPAGWRCSTSCCPDPAGLGRCIPPCGIEAVAGLAAASEGPTTGKR